MFKLCPWGSLLLAPLWPLTFSSGERPRALWALLFIYEIIMLFRWNELFFVYEIIVLFRWNELFFVYEIIMLFRWNELFLYMKLLCCSVEMKCFCTWNYYVVPLKWNVFCIWNYYLDHFIKCLYGIFKLSCFFDFVSNQKENIAEKILNKNIMITMMTTKWM